jgi:hypothetical protein
MVWRSAWAARERRECSGRLHSRPCHDARALMREVRYAHVDVKQEWLWCLPIACAMLCGQVETKDGTRSTRQSEAKEFRKDAAATKAIPADFGDATLWLDPTRGDESDHQTAGLRGRPRSGTLRVYHHPCR